MYQFYENCIKICSPALWGIYDKAYEVNHLESMARTSRSTYTYNCIMIFTHCFRSHSYLTHCCCCCFFPSLLIPWFDNQCWPFFPRWQDEKEQQTLNSLAERKVFVCSCVLLLSITFRSMKSCMKKIWIASP